MKTIFFVCVCEIFVSRENNLLLKVLIVLTIFIKKYADCDLKHGKTLKPK